MSHRHVLPPPPPHSPPVRTWWPCGAVNCSAQTAGRSAAASSATLGAVTGRRAPPRSISRISCSRELIRNEVGARVSGRAASRKNSCTTCQGRGVRVCTQLSWGGVGRGRTGRGRRGQVRLRELRTGTGHNRYRYIHRQCI